MPGSGVSPPLLIRARDGKGASIAADPATGVAVGCREWEQYEISVDWDGPCRLLVDEVELAPVSGSVNVWAWQAGFFAGEVLAELLESSGIQIGTYRFDVSPDPDKLGRDAFAEMVEEVFDFDPRLVLGSEAARTTVGLEGSITDPHLEYARLKLYGPQFLSALRLLCRRPQSQLLHQRERQPMHRVRRLDRTSVCVAMHEPAPLGILAGAVSAGDGELALFDIPSTREGFDNPANRAILSVLQAVLRRTRSVRAALTSLAMGESANTERDSLKPRLPRRLHFLTEFESSLKRFLLAHPFVVVSRAEISAAGLNAVSAHPLYARTYRTGWNILRTGIGGQRGEETLWMSPTWSVYERWCFITAFRALQNVYPGAVWERHFPSSREDCILFAGSHSSVTVKIYFQARFPAFDQAPWRSFSSVSGERYPDIVVTVEQPSSARFLVLDAKYRVSRANVLEGMESAHLYRDSLRWNGMPPQFALLLVPASGGASWLEDSTFWSEHGVGITPVSTDGGQARLEQVLRSLLGAH